MHGEHFDCPGCNGDGGWIWTRASVECRACDGDGLAKCGALGCRELATVDLRAEGGDLFCGEHGKEESNAAA